MICSKCNSKWESNSSTDKCPFCGTQLSKRTQEINPISSGIREIISSYGIDIFLDSKKLLSLIMDLVQGYEREKKLLRIALNQSINEVIYRVSKTDNEEQQRLIVQKAIKTLKDDAFISEENSHYIMGILLESVNLDYLSRTTNFKDVNFSSWDEILTEAKNANVYAQYITGHCYSSGIIVDKDLERSTYWFDQAAKLGFDWGQYGVGCRHYFNKEATEEDMKYAAEQFVLAAKRGHIWAMSNYAACLVRGKGIEKNEASALEYYISASYPVKDLAENALNELKIIVTACESIEPLYQDLKNTLERYEDNVQNGDKVAQFALAMCYQTGKGTLLDYSKAIPLFEILVNRKYYKACFELGYCYEKGLGVSKDKNKALELYSLGEKLAKEQGQRYFDTEFFKNCVKKQK